MQRTAVLVLGFVSTLYAAGPRLAPLAQVPVTYSLFRCPSPLSDRLTLDTAPYAINPNGLVTGSCGVYGFIFDTNTGHFTTMFTAGIPTAININGDVAGYYYTGNQDPYTYILITNGFVRLASGAITTFSAGGSNFPTFANGINSNGIVVGDWIDGFNRPNGFVRNADGSFADLYLHKVTPYAINDANQFAGSWYDVGDKPHGFTMHITDQTYTSIAPDLYNQQLVTAINNAGNVVGSETTYTTPFQSQAFLTAPNLTFFPSMLPSAAQLYYAAFPKTKLPYGGGINALGVAVMQDQYRATDGTITTIDLGFCRNVMAQGINDSGVVVGSCTSNGLTFGFQWTVPGATATFKHGR